MASTIETLPRPQLARQPWPPDDTEESVVGTDFHQMTIMNVRFGINEVAHTLTLAGQPVPWQALSQTTVSGFTHPDGSPYSTMPDMFVYRRPMDQDRGSMAVGVDGPPVLVVEMLSERTYKWDLDMENGKGYSYAASGVREYLMLDPTSRYLPERLRAWRLTDGSYQPWQPDKQGRWHSQELALAFALEGPFAAVYARGERRMLREGEVEAERARAREAL